MNLWDYYFMAIAMQVAKGSKCLRAQYGTVIVSQDRRIIATGFNGKPRGSKNDDVCYRNCPDAERTHECCIHSERNAIMFCSPEQRQGATMYVTGIPCKTCSLHIMQSGIKRLVCLEYTHSDSGKRVSDDAFWEAYGVPIERIFLTAEEAEKAMPEEMQEVYLIRMVDRSGTRHAE